MSHLLKESFIKTKEQLQLVSSQLSQEKQAKEKVDEQAAKAAQDTSQEKSLHKKQQQDAAEMSKIAQERKAVQETLRDVTIMVVELKHELTKLGKQQARPP